ncbi:MAG TPA: hypothetical protein VEG44_08695 [Candidatus Acidoferrales bacterium]|nr:hypothetical protein [Candidatus Acidoferrales bacterium]
MPYKDPEVRREYNREYQKMRRAGLNVKSHSAFCQTIFLTSYRIEKAKDLLHILEDAINLVREDTTIGTVQRARTFGYLVGIGIRVIETSNMEERIEALEQALKSET